VTPTVGTYRSAMSQSDGLANRVRLLAHPLVTGSLALLAVNDHVLKAWSGPLSGPLAEPARTVTGKSSDFAGVMLLALLAGIVTGRRVPSLTAVGLGFAALKLSPSVASLAAPLLGGVTRTDPTDLIALLALGPAHRFLARTGPASPAAIAPPSPGPGRLALFTRPALTVLVLFLAVPAITATSPCGDPPLIDTLAVSTDGRIYTHVSGDRSDRRGTASRPPPDEGPGSGSTAAAEDVNDPMVGRWAVSDDGRTWTRADQPPPDAANLIASVPSAMDCEIRASCYRVRGQRVEQRGSDGRWATSFAFTAEQRRRMELRPDSCAGESIASDGFREVIVVDDDIALVSMGSQGVLRREGNGDWERIAVLRQRPISLSGPSWLAAVPLVGPIVLLVAAFVVLGIGWARGRRGMGAVGGAIAIIGALLIAVISALLAAGGPLGGTGDYASNGQVIAGACVVVFLISLAFVALPHGRASPHRSPEQLR